MIKMRNEDNLNTDKTTPMCTIYCCRKEVFIMNKELKSQSNNLQSFSSTNAGDAARQQGFSSKVESKEEKSEGNNQWDSVPATYDKEESMHKHEKTATNNQWCSTSK